MCEHHHETREDGKVVMGRRELLIGLASGSVVAMSGCATNPYTGRSQLMLVSDAQLMQLSASAWQETKSQEKAASSPAAIRRAESVAQRMIPNSGLENLPWEVGVFESDQINAFVLPGGKMGVYTGLMDIADNDDQLAAVVGHEISHVNGKHAAERVSQQLAAGVGLTIAEIAVASSDTQYKREIMAALGAGVTFGVILPYSRRQELEADKLGVDLMAKSGYKPSEALRFWENMAKANAGRQKPPEFLSTHPSDETRISELRRHIAVRGYA